MYTNKLNKLFWQTKQKHIISGGNKVISKQWRDTNREIGTEHKVLYIYLQWI